MTMHAVLKLTLVCLVVGVAANRQRWGRIEKDYTFRSFNLKSPSSGVLLPLFLAPPDHLPVL